MISVYGNMTDNNLTIRDQDAMEKYVRLIQWGRKNPVQFIEKVLQIPLLDYQKWLIANTWSRRVGVWVCSRNAGKSFLVGIFMQTRAILFPKSKINIIGAVGRQSSESFVTMENIIKNNVKSLIRQNTVVFDEVAKSKADTDGFTHDQKKGDSVTFLNGSNILAVVGAAKNVVGKRSNMLCFDESGIITQELFNLVEPFATQSSDFKTGANYDSEVFPPDVPNLMLYVGSATDTNSPFYAKYKDAFKQMLIGNEDYFVADLNCEAPLHPTMNGVATTPLLTQETIDKKMRENPVSCYREYYNIFDRFDSEDCVLSRSDVVKFRENFIPRQWMGKKHKYIITYDPASRVDNAPVLVTEVVEREGRIKGRFVHMENLVHLYGDGVKKPMTIEEQVQRLREIIYYWNGGDRVPAYDNVKVFLDFGVGGQAPAIAQELCKDWVDSEGKTHPGIYDDEAEDVVRWAEKYPSAIPGVVKMLEPNKYRSAMFDAVRVLAPMGDLIFAAEDPKDEYLLIPNEETGQDDARKLSRAERESLIQMRLMVEEMCLIVRSKNKQTGKISYGLPPEWARKVHDDRAYVMAMASWAIKQEQETTELGEPKGLDYSKFVKRDPLANQKKPVEESRPNPFIGKGPSRNNGSGKGKSPFQGRSPFTK